MLSQYEMQLAKFHLENGSNSRKVSIELSLQQMVCFKSSMPQAVLWLYWTSAILCITLWLVEVKHQNIGVMKEGVRISADVMSVPNSLASKLPNNGQSTKT